MPRKVKRKIRKRTRRYYGGESTVIGENNINALERNGVGENNLAAIATLDQPITPPFQEPGNLAVPLSPEDVPVQPLLLPPKKQKKK